MKTLRAWLNQNQEFVFSIFLWFFNGIFLAWLLIGLGGIALIQYVPIHPGPGNASANVSTSNNGGSDSSSWPRVDELYLVKSSVDQKSGKDNRSNSFDDINLDSVEKIEDSSLPLEVVGITYGPPEFRSVTLRNLETRNKETLKVGGNWSNATIQQIRRSEVLIKNKKSGQPEILRLSRDYKNLANQTESKEDDSEKSKSISRYKVNEAIQYNMNNLLESVEVTPAFRRGEIIGLQIGELQGRPGQLLQKLGFKSQDIITRVNGQKIDDIDQALKLWSQLRHQKQFEVQVSRNGETKTFEYELTR